MIIDHPLPQTIREIEHLEIPMPDGTRLAARVWMPEGAEAAPVPAILEFIPYRKNDKTLERDHARAPWMAAQGYAYVRVDLRGTGESEGLMTDEYTEEELQDGCDVIAWIAAQDWCDGGVGIVGISWGGFNGLQLAALRPPALKAVVTICSTDDRYADDIHYMGGTLLGDHLSWASVMFGINTLPPDPAHVGDRWREMWEERLDGSGLWLENWMQHQTRDAFWKHGSVCEDFSDIEVPVYAVSGWADGYCRAVFRLVENLKSPVKGLVGPWSHRYPHLGEPGPAIDWLTEEVRWWDQWMKGRDTGIADEPKLRVFLQDHARPQTHYDTRDGVWIDEPAWPSPNVERRAFSLTSDGGLGAEGPQDALDICSPLWVGRHGGKWCSYGHPGDQPGDQRREDAGSLTFQTAPLTEDCHMVGDPELTLTFEVDKPVAQVALRLMDVAPDGAATRVSYGLLNLTHRDSHEHPENLEPGRKYTVRVPMKHVAQTFRAGHRIRLGVSTSYFPVAWPAPEPVTLTMLTGECVLELPMRKDAPEAVDAFGPARSAELLELDVERAPGATWRLGEDVDTGMLSIEVTDDEGAATIRSQGYFHAAAAKEHYTILPEDPTSATGEVTWTHEMAREDWSVKTVTRTRMTCTASDYLITARLEAFLNGDCIRELDWDVRIPRDHN
ncbi:MULTISPECIES: CocE/NonD family hydrolase [Roseovarius]|uniref:CocE/NonD family hydrolase n=1 Tax=Roseovarius TaxID=74030 RepID=UPI00273D98CC|nr:MULTISPECIES: CocE/NonD family hydrolase [unclassified Roseovarius]